MTELKLFNSLTRQIEPFTPIRDDEVSVYTCGPTVYNYPHIGNMRAYVFADTLGRVLTYKGYTLKHVINITDVGHLTDDGDAGEDKMEKMAAERAQSIWDIAKHYTQAYWADIRALNIREPMQWSIATDYVPQMIEFAESIADRHCYQLDSGLYFDTSTVADYGRLARANTDANDSQVEGRIEAVDGKRHAADFAIWRKTPTGESRQMEWDSPWGKGAPGWHLECSVMSKEILGLPFDIHTGGIDHREIHHPNEIAQNQAITGCGSLDCAEHSGARFWMHNNFLIDRTGKMSKSSGEFLRVQLLIDKGFHPLAYRLMCLQAHYRSELEFSWEGLQAAFVRLKRMVMRLSIGYGADEGIVSPYTVDVTSPDTLEILEGNQRRFDDVILDDLGTPTALILLEQAVVISPVSLGDRRRFIQSMDSVLGLNLLTLTRQDLRIRPTTATITEPEIEAALTERKAARAAKDFATSDRIRDDLIAKGVDVMDGDPLGWDWKLDV